MERTIPHGRAPLNRDATTAAAPVATGRVVYVRALAAGAGGASMRVTNIHGPDDIRVDEAPDPVCGPRDVVVQMRACGVCGTDVTFAHLGGMPFGGPRPMPLGHEPAGEIVEVGDEVREAFLAHAREAAAGFAPQANGKWLADLYQLAAQRLHAAGVARVFGGGFCTWHEQERFYSYRRDKNTGRMASLIWME